MTYKAKLKVQFDTEWTPTYGGSGMYDDETLPEEHYTFEIPCEDINTIQLFRFFGTIARSMGHNELGIMKGACSLAFNDTRSEEDMKKIAYEFDLKLSEEYSKEFAEMQDEIYDLKKQLASLEIPDNDTDMYDEKYSPWNGLIPGSYEAHKHGCKCPILDNQDMPNNRKWVNGDCPLHGKAE
jgi:hypothetical protein